MLIQKRHLPIFLKIVLMFLITVIPIYVCGLWINMSGQEEVRKEIFESTQPKIDFYLNMLENEFKSVLQTRLIFYTDADLQLLSREASTLKDYSKYLAMQKLQEKLASFRDVSNYITSVSIYIPLIHKTISDRSVQDMSDEEFADLRQAIESEQFPFAEKNGKIFMYSMPYYSEITVKGAKCPPYIICIEVSREKLVDTLKQFSGYESGNAFLYGAANGLNISGNAGSDVENAISKYLVENNGSDTDTHIETVRVGNENFVVILKKSDALKTNFVLYVPEGQLLLPLLRYRIWLWVASFVTVALVLLFSVWIRRMVVKPLNVLMNAFAKIENGDFNISLNNKEENEFGYLYKRVNILCERLAMLIEKIYEDKIIVRDSEIKSLQYQVNPAIFGMMDSVQSACRQIYRIWAETTTSGREVDWDQLNGKFEALEQIISQAATLHSGNIISEKGSPGGSVDLELEKERTDCRHIRTMLKKTQLMEILLESGQQNEFMELYTSFITSVKEHCHAPFNMKQEAYYSLATLFLSCLNKMGISDKIGEHVALGKLMRMEDHGSWDEADSYFRSIANAVFEHTIAKKCHYGNQIVSLVESYIEQNLGSDLSLTTISEKLHFNPSYFSRLFKSISGKGLAEYISELKVVKAKELLVNDEMKINEIAESLGFKFSTSFTRFFRKYTNQSPQEYKDSLRIINKSQL